MSRKVRALTTKEPPKVCQSGKTFHMDCNKCICDNEGQQFLCTRIDCNDWNNNHHASTFTGARSKRESDQSFRCIPGEHFKRDCNNCICSPDGTSYCTMRACIQALTSDI